MYFVAIGIVQNVLTGGGGCQLEKNLKLRLVHIVYQNVEIPPPCVNTSLLLLATAGYIGNYTLFIITL